MDIIMEADGDAMEVEEVRLTCHNGQQEGDAEAEDGHINNEKGPPRPAAGSNPAVGGLETNCGGIDTDTTTITGNPVSGGVGGPGGVKEPDDDEEIKLLEVIDHSQDSDSKSSVDRKADLKRCDCLTENCPGCHYPCSNCRSRYCGHVCKLLRDWHYEEVIVQGHDLKRKSPLGPNL